MPILKPLLPFFTLFIVPAAAAQDWFKPINKIQDYKRTTVFFNPLNVLEPEIPIAVTFQRRINKKFAVALDIGMFVTSDNIFFQDRPSPATGFRLKPEFKIYFLDPYETLRKSVNYFSFQGLIKRVSVNESETVGRQCSNGQCAYFQTIDYKKVKEVYGGSVIIGKERFLGKQQHFYMGVYIGLGLRYKHFYDKDLPADVAPNNYDSNNGRLITINANGWYPSVPMGINIGWRIK